MSTEHQFYIDYDKRGAAKCKKCKQKIEKLSLRIARLVANHFSDDGAKMKNWFHVDCLFESFKKARATTKKIEDPAEDIDGWQDIEDDDKKLIKDKVKAFEETSHNSASKLKVTPKKESTKNKVPLKKSPVIKTDVSTENDASNISTEKVTKSVHKDDMFKEFRRLCANIAEVSSYLSKTDLVSKYFKEGSDGTYKGNTKLTIRLLIPGVIKRVYNLQSKTLIKLFSQLFDADYELMIEDLEKGDVAETIRVFFESSNSICPTKKSLLTIEDVDDYLEELKNLTTEDTQLMVLKRITKRCTGNDLKMIIRLIKGDLRINAGAKHILEGIHPDAYEAFQTSRNIDMVLDEVLKQTSSSPNKRLKLQALVMTPVLPMLAEACRSVEQALKKCPKGMYAEIKYDGERVQLHKEGSDFKYFSRSLKPVLSHKVSHFKDYIPDAFPKAKSLILDAEVLLVDTKTNVPLPFGSLGVHKKQAFRDANVCLFVFDCIHYNGEDYMDRPISERRTILEDNMIEIPHRVVLSEMKEIHKADELQNMIHRVFEQGLEGLVLKPIQSVYEPGKRHWLKVKKDYLHEGAMADSADLVVLGAWFGTGKKGGMMSVFLMGCYDTTNEKWCTVTKVHTGHDDAALEMLQKTLKMDKISQVYDNLPSWINCSRSLTPDFITKDPKNSPVWEITGAEFTKNKGHTANGISIRFPRVTKVRSDKEWKDATDLKRLQELYEKSKEHTDYVGLASDDDDLGTPKKRKSDSSYNSPESKKPKLDKDVKEIATEFIPPVQSPLPSVFKGIKMYLKSSIDNEESKDLHRYFIAYGGEIVDEFSSEATHFITHGSEKKKSSSKREKRVTTEWLWDSIKSNKLQPVEL